MTDASTLTTLWWAVIFSGLYHGINPGMGWPLAVSAALMEGKKRALPKALIALAIGHFLSMTLILLPFSLIFALVEYQREIQITAAAIVIIMGTYLLINRRHPKILARIHPTKLALWSFLAALAHGAGLMLVPIYLGICKVEPGTGHAAAATLMNSNVITALMVAGAHTLAMITAGGVMAAVIYWWLGLKFLSRTWFNLDLVWALSLVVVGVFGIYTVMVGH